MKTYRLTEGRTQGTLKSALNKLFPYVTMVSSPEAHIHAMPKVRLGTA
ncbi:MAG: hypothetical protein AB1664_20880 [Thermodesulfobacteriota bacterium]